MTNLPTFTPEQPSEPLALAPVAVAGAPAAPAAATSPAPAHEHRVRVYWEDTDAGGIVFYANYLKFFERARTEWLRSLGIGQQALRESDGLMFVVTETRVRHRAPARLDDELRVTALLAEAGRASLRISQQAWRGHTLLAEGDIRIGCVQVATLRPARLPATLRTAMGLED